MDTPLLTAQQEAFCLAYMVTLNASAAYRQAYNVAATTKWTTVATDSSRLMAHPHVAARIRQLQDEAAGLSSIPALATRIQELRSMETADTNDIISLKVVNCRYCHGFNYGWQWIDEMEYAQAVDAAIQAKKPHPNMDGGFGFHGMAEPAPECPRCYGEGVQHVRIKDTTKLTGGARLLYKGVKIKANGDTELLLHDQMQARDMLNRIQGAYKDGAVPVAPGTAIDKQAEQAKTPEQLQRLYMKVAGE
jgi:phage terminase small subunit